MEQYFSQGKYFSFQFHPFKSAYALLQMQIVSQDYHKYLIASMAESFIDFHIDYGGTSVFFHLIKGKKVFFLMPPTERNVKAYLEWSSILPQKNVFFPDTLLEVTMLRYYTTIFQIHLFSFRLQIFVLNLS